MLVWEVLFGVICMFLDLFGCVFGCLFECLLGSVWIYWSVFE